MLITKPKFPIFWLIAFYILGIFLLYGAYGSYISGSSLFATIVIISTSVLCFILGLIIYNIKGGEQRWANMVESLYEKISVSKDKIILPESLLVKPALLTFEMYRATNRLRFRVKIEPKGDEIYAKEIKCWGVENFRLLDSIRASLLVLPGWIVEDTKYVYRRNKLFISCLYPIHFKTIENSTIAEHDDNVVRLEYRISDTNIQGELELLSFEEEKAKSIILRISSIFESVGRMTLATRDIAKVDKNIRKAIFKGTLFPKIKDITVLFINTNDKFTIYKFEDAFNISLKKDVILGFNEILIELLAKGKIFADVFYSEKVKLLPKED